MSSPEERRQQWRYIGAISILVAVGIFGLLFGYGFSDHANDQQNKDLRTEVRDQAGEILTNRARINQLEAGYANQGLPIPAPPTTTTTPPPRRSTSTTRPTSTTTTSSPPPTTTTTSPPPPRGTCIAGVCITRPQEKP